MHVCLVGGVICDFVCITQAKLQSMAYWYGWFVKYICNLQIYDGKCGPLTEMVGFLLEPYEGKGYHLCHNNYYKGVHQTNDYYKN